MRNKKLFILLMSAFFFIITGCSNATEPPEAVATINGEKIEIVRGTYQWEKRGLFSNSTVIADAAAPFQIAADMKATLVKPGSAVSIEFSDGSAPQLDAYLWEGEERGKELSSKETQIILPSQSGKHVIEMMAKWPNGEASYTFVVEVQ